MPDSESRAVLDPEDTGEHASCAPADTPAPCPFAEVPLSAWREFCAAASELAEFRAEALDLEHGMTPQSEA